MGVHNPISDWWMNFTRSLIIIFDFEVHNAISDWWMNFTSSLIKLYLILKSMVLSEADRSIFLAKTASKTPALPLRCSVRGRKKSVSCVCCDYYTDELVSQTKSKHPRVFSNDTHEIPGKFSHLKYIWFWRFWCYWH